MSLEYLYCHFGFSRNWKWGYIVCNLCKFSFKEMLSVFTLWTFKLPVYESNFKRHLNVDYISLRWYDIPELLFPIKICSHNEWVIASKYLCHRYLETVPLVVVITPSFMRWWLITVSVTRVTRRILLVEQEMLTLPEHLSSPWF